MRVLRIAGAVLICAAICPALFLAAYAAIVAGWTVYADLSGVLDVPGPAARTVALFWAPLGALLSGAAGTLLAAGLLLRGSRRGARQRRPASGSARPAELTGDAVLVGHADLLRQLHRIVSDDPRPEAEPGNPDRPRATIDWGREKKVA